MKNEIVELFLEEGLTGKSDTTISTYRTEILLFEKYLLDVGANLKNFARTDVQQYINNLIAQKKAASTINKAWYAIKAFCKWANKEDAILDIRVVKQENIKEKAPKSLDKKQRNKLIREVDRYDSKRNYAIVMLLLNTGLRVSELVSLDRDDISMSERKGSLRVIGKGNKERTIPLNYETRRALTLYLNERTDNNKALFISNQKRRISKRSVQRIIEKFGYHAHQLRHTFITDLVRKGEDFSVIKSLTGHESIEMVTRYSAPTEDDKIKAIENLYTD